MRTHGWANIPIITIYDPITVSTVMGSGEDHILVWSKTVDFLDSPHAEYGMPIDTSISPEEQLIHITIHGEISTQDSLSLMSELPGRADYDPHYCILIDSTKANRGPDLKDMRVLASAARKFTKHFLGNIALVVNPGYVRQSSVFGLLIRPFGIHFEVYGDVESAKQFLSTGSSWVEHKGNIS